MEMEFTGERYVPSMRGAIRYEHLHRYALSLEFVQGKSVLDIASGEGYGSAILSQVASSVVGVDIDSSCISFACKKYASIANLEFLVGACDAFPLANESVDVVTSFETIEHHAKHDEMMQEIKRVLKPGGTLIISSPNRLTYSEQPKSLSSNPNNPFHVKEPYDYQFISLLNRHFKSVKIYGQRLAIGSFVFPLKHGVQSGFKSYTIEDSQSTQQIPSLAEPLYFIAVCSDDSTNIQNILDSIYIDKDDDVLMELREQLILTSGELAQIQLQCGQTEAKLESSQAQLHQTEAVLEQTYSQLHQTQAKLEQSQSQLHQTQAELEQSQSQLHQTELFFQQSQVQLNQIQEKLEDTLSQLQHTSNELERLQFQQVIIVSNSGSESQMEYKLLVGDAWCAYQKANMAKMQYLLHKSLKCSPTSRTETILNWLDSFSEYAGKKGIQFDTESLVKSEAWQQLLKQIISVKPRQ